MSAMKIIDEVHAAGGKIKSFLSYCGGLPCPDDNDNPFGYKFSWSPKGVLLVSVQPRFPPAPPLSPFAPLPQRHVVVLCATRYVC